MTGSWHCGRFQLTLERPLIMGVLNVTPDSFSDGGCYSDPAAALARAHQLLADGADIIDIGGESTRPGAETVPVAVELLRVLPVIEGLRGLGVPLSLDTRHTQVMVAGIAAGVDIINDVGALEAPGALSALAATKVGVCLMHKRGEPGTMQAQPEYGDVVAEVAAYLHGRAAAAVQAGIAPARIVVDPGFGFGKTLQHNLHLLRDLAALRPWPVLAGLSRKSMIGQITGRAVGERLPGSIAAALLAVQRGAAIVRVHDVAATRDALLILAAVEQQHNSSSG